MRCVDLFCGAGGMSLGFERAGFEIVGAVDCAENALRVYKSNLSHPVLLADIKNIFPVGQWVRSLKPDVVIGGPPCQDFSAAGSRHEQDNAAMTVAFAMTVCVVRPRWFVMENVPQMLNSQAWTQARELLAESGYGISISRVDAAHYGVPQHRKRVIVIGRLGEADDFLESAIKQAASEKPMTVREMLGDEAPEYYYTHARFPGKRCCFRADEPSPTVRSTSRRPVPKRFHDEDALLLAAGAYFTRPFHEGRGVRNLDEPAPAIIRTSRECPRPGYLASPHPRDPVHPSKAAVLTQSQVSRLQGFPYSWDWSAASTLRDIDQMIANAVPPPLARAIGEVILERERGGISSVPGEFLIWLRKSLGLSEHVVRNIQIGLSRAWQYLAGRIFADAGHELHAIETSVGFAALDVGRRCDLRKALRLHQEWRSVKCTPAGLVAHRMPCRGGLRTFFRNVGSRMGFRNSHLGCYNELASIAHGDQPKPHEPIAAEGCSEDRNADNPAEAWEQKAQDIEQGPVCEAHDPGSLTHFAAFNRKMRARDLTIFGGCLGSRALPETNGGELRQLAVPEYGEPICIHVSRSGDIFSG